MDEESSEFQELTQIGKCIVSVNKKSDIRIECEEPIVRLDINKTDLDLVAGVSDTVEEYTDVVKKKEN